LSKVFVHMGISLDGFVAGVNRGPHNPLGHMGMKVHEWMFRTRAFRENLEVGPELASLACRAFVPQACPQQVEQLAARRSAWREFRACRKGHS
jgi:hypothetical protein